MTSSLRSRYLGCLLGLACGDAVGTTVEFSPPGSFPRLNDMVGGGPFGLAPGQWTDDTSMALCLAESLVERGGFDARDQMTRYLNWWKWGYLSSTGECFDIGMTVARALDRFAATGEAYAGPTSPETAGNGSLMRLAPIPLRYFPALDLIDRYAAESSRTTHGAPQAIECCRLLAAQIAAALSGADRETVLTGHGCQVQDPAIQAIAKGQYRGKPAGAVQGSAYCVASLEAAVWSFASTENFRDAILRAANLGDDADTTAAITGQLAGAFYGVEGIPAAWLERLHAREQISDLAERLLAAASATPAAGL